MILLLISFLLFLISYYFVPKTKKFLVFFIVFSVIYFAFSILFIIGNYFTGKGVDESVLYQLFSGVKGAGVDFFVVFLGFFCFIFCFSLLFAFYFFRKKFDFSAEKHFKIFFCFALILSILHHPVLKNFQDMGFFTKISENEEIIYEVPEVKKKTEKTKNLIYIYLESFEKLYLDEKIFPGVAKNLQNLSEKSVFFENVEQAFGTSWTIAGMVGSQCGTPLINSGGGGNSMHGIEDFLPGAFCIGDYLKQAGYNLTYVGGADLSFAGKGNFYKTHGFSNILGKKTLEKKLKDKNYKNYWGLYDDSIFDFLYEEYEKLSSKSENFGLFTITMDTHLNDGFVSKSCPEKNFDKEILKSYNCSDFLLGKFLEKIQKHPNFKNTIIVISSDHYAMKANATTPILEENSENRKNLFLIIDGEKFQKIDKKATTLDIGPTVLDFLGFEIEKLGFGVNILSEKEGIENDNLRFYRNIFERFWKFPTLKNGIEFNYSNKKIFIDGKEISFPALLVLNNDFDTEKILWQDAGNPDLIERIRGNTIYFSFYKGEKFCVNFGEKERQCFIGNGKISYDEILRNFKE